MFPKHNFNEKCVCSEIVFSKHDFNTKFEILLFKIVGRGMIFQGSLKGQAPTMSFVQPMLIRPTSPVLDMLMMDMPTSGVVYSWKFLGMNSRSPIMGMNPKNLATINSTPSIMPLIRKMAKIMEE